MKSYYNPNDHVPTSSRMRSHGHGFSHGLKIARPLSIFTPVCGLVPPFRIPIRWQKEKPHRMVWFFFLAEDEGFEPPQTESESGVLPLHKSSKRDYVIIRTRQKKSSIFYHIYDFISAFPQFPKGKAFPSARCRAGKQRLPSLPRPAAW